MIDALLIYPNLGSMDSMVVDLPLSIIYAASHSVKQGYRIQAVDLRCETGDWRPLLDSYLAHGVRLAGISVMTGSPLSNAREISIYIKEKYKNVKIIWGGPHATVLPETIHEWYIDFLIRGYGSEQLASLISFFRQGSPALSEIKGLSYENGGEYVHNLRADSHEMISFRDLPYHLIDVNSEKYIRSYKNMRLFPIYSAIGCPYKCAFCVHPTVYRVINGKKWMPFPLEEVMAHIKYLMAHYKVTQICFIDDTSFVDLKRMRKLFQMIIDQKLNVTLEFRGARVNEIDRMDDDFLDLMVKAGGRVMMVGVESASDRILKKMQKGISKAQIIRINKKLAQYPELTPYYNFIYGCPGETYDDLVETKEVVLQLLKDNPYAYFGFGGDWKPIPGSKMLDTAVQDYDFKPPETLDEWIEIDSSDSQKKIVHPWYTPRHNNLIKLMQISSFVIDDKILKESKGNASPIFVILRTLSRMYKPIAWFRLKYNLHQFLIEYELWRYLLRIISHIKGKKSSRHAKE